jgi:hypothetical protein
VVLLCRDLDLFHRLNTTLKDLHLLILNYPPSLTPPRTIHPRLVNQTLIPVVFLIPFNCDVIDSSASYLLSEIGVILRYLDLHFVWLLVFLQFSDPILKQLPLHLPLLTHNPLPVSIARHAPRHTTSPQTAHKPVWVERPKAKVVLVDVHGARRRTLRFAVEGGRGEALPLS